MRQNYEMTEKQFNVLMEATKEVPLIALQCGMPESPQARANKAWKNLGEELSFKYMTVQPLRKGDHFFSAETM